MASRVVALDVETTGLTPEEDRVIEFCLVTLDDELNELDRWTQRVNPGIPIPDETTQIHGITDADVADCPPFTEFAPKVQAILHDAIIMAYNHGFDMNVLHYELVRAGQPGLRMDHPVIDPLFIFRENFPHSLAGAVKHYTGESLQDAHTAEADTDAMLQVFRAQIKAHGLPTTATENVLVRDRRYLDRSKRFYEDPEGIVRFGFGKYRHEPVEGHISYMQWILAKDFPEDTKNVAAQLVDRFIERPPDRSASQATL